MADTRGDGASIFRKSAMNRISSVDDLDRYIKVSNPSIWVVLSAVIVLLAAFTFWAFTANLPVRMSTAGFIINDTDGSLHVACFFDAESAASISEGGQAYVGNEAVTIESIDKSPLSKREVSDMMGLDYEVQEMRLGTWNYFIMLSAPKGYEQGELVPVQLIAESRSPISYILELG